MTVDEAIAAMDEPLVAVQRDGTRWHGRVVGVVEEPALIIEVRSGHRFALVLAGANLVPMTEEVPVATLEEKLQILDEARAAGGDASPRLVDTEETAA